MKNTDDTQKIGRNLYLTGLAAKRFAVSGLALATAFAAITPAYATIDNTVTATGEAPGGDPGDPGDDITATADETVDVADAAPDIVVTKTADVTSNVGVGDTITYTYTVENTGNVTLTAVSLSDAHEGTGTGPTPTLGGAPLTDNGTAGDSTDDAADNTWDTLAPGDLITWTGTYVVTQADLNNQADNDLDNTVTASATPAAGTIPPASLTADEEVDLEDQNASLAVTKVADDDSDVVAGQTITYTYVVTNDGNVPITDVSLADSVTAGSGGNPIPALQSLTNTSGNSSDDGLDNVVNLLQPGDSATYTGTYVVTQDDVDNLQ